MAGKSWQSCHEPSCGRGSVTLIKPEGKGERREGQMLVTKHKAKKQQQQQKQNKKKIKEY